MRRRRLGWTIALAAVAVALAVLGLRPSAKAARPAPALPAQHLIGPASTSLASVIAGAGGRPVLVVFWASWCGPCASEAPVLERFARGEGRGRMIGVDWSDALSGARSFLRRYRWSFPNLRDAEGTVGNAYGLTGLPTTFVIDEHGRIRRALRGPQSAVSLGGALAAATHG